MSPFFTVFFLHESVPQIRSADDDAGGGGNDNEDDGQCIGGGCAIGMGLGISRIQYCSTTRLQIIATTDTFLPASSIIISQHVHVNCHTLLNIEYFVPLALLKSS